MPGGHEHQEEMRSVGMKHGYYMGIDNAEHNFLGLFHHLGLQAVQARSRNRERHGRNLPRRVDNADGKSNFRSRDVAPPAQQNQSSRFLSRIPRCSSSHVHGGNLSELMHNKIRNSEFHVLPNAADLSNLDNPAEFNKQLTNFVG